MAMNRSSTVKLLCVVVAIAAMAVSTEALTCGDVARGLGPCLGYLKSSGGAAVPGQCCSGIRSLNSAAKTTADRQTACKCIKAASGGVNAGLAAGLPGKCGLSIPYKISPSTNCNT